VVRVGSESATLWMKGD